MFPLARQSALRAARSQIYPSRALNQPASALARLLSTLAVLEQRNGKLQNSSLAAIAAAQKLGGSVTGFVAGSGVKGSSAAEAAKIKGVEKVVAVDNDAYEKVEWRYFRARGICTDDVARVCLRITLLSWWKISRTVVSPTSSLPTLPSARAFCLV